MKLFRSKPKPRLAFTAGEHIAQSGILVRHLDVTGVPAQELHDAVSPKIAAGFDLHVRDSDRLRVEWSETRILTTADIVFLPDDIRRALIGAKP